jgi:hypothetical protein
MSRAKTECRVTREQGHRVFRRLQVVLDADDDVERSSRKWHRDADGLTGHLVIAERA